MAGMEYDPRPDMEKFIKMSIEAAKTMMQIYHRIDCEIKYKQVLKNNGQIYDGLMFERSGSKVHPTVYINDAYEEYKQNPGDLDKIIRNIVDTAYHSMNRKIEVPEISADTIKEHVRLKVVNAQSNEELLKDTPHFTLADGELAAYPKYYYPSGEASFRITDSMCMSDQVMLTPDELLTQALSNTQSMEYKVSSITDVLQEITGKSVEEMDLIPEEISPQMVVCTTMDGVDGASVLLSPPAMEQAKKLLGCDSMYLIPSSTSEVIAVKDDGSIKPNVLSEMIKEVNVTQLRPEEILADVPLKFADGKLMLAIQPELEIAKDVVMAVAKTVEKTFENSLDNKMSMSMA